MMFAGKPVVISVRFAKSNSGVEPESWAVYRQTGHNFIERREGKRLRAAHPLVPALRVAAAVKAGFVRTTPGL